MNDFLGWFVLAVVGGFVLLDLAAVWGALRVHAQSGEWLLASSADDDEYPQRPETLRTTYDVRTYPERTDERIEALEDAIRKLMRRVEELENDHHRHMA